MAQDVKEKKKKICKKCNTFKNIEEFYDSSLKTGIGITCNKCKGISGNNKNSKFSKSSRKTNTRSSIKSSEKIPQCPKCRKTMVKRYSPKNRNWFWGCSNFNGGKGCRGTRSL